MTLKAAPVALAVMLCVSSWAQEHHASRPPTADAGAQTCIAAAARHHQVNPLLLRAILKLESNLNPRAVGRNANGTIDVGIGQINSRHFPLLAAHGIQPGHLLDPCIGSFVAAWHLSRVIAVHGNTWEAVARYHSATPYFNRRYRILLNNELVAAGVIAGNTLPVPPLGQARLATSRRSSRAVARADPPALIVDRQEAGP